MNISKDNTVSHEMRSPLSVNVAEVVFAIAVALVTWFGLRSFLQSALPYPCGAAINNVVIDCGWTEEQAWQTLGMPLFSKYALPFVVFNTLAAIFLIRAIRQDVQGFSRLGSVALAWSLLSVLGIPFLFFFGGCVLPIGFLLSILATAISVEEKRHKLDWISLPISFVSMVVIGMYFVEFMNLYGD